MSLFPLLVFGMFSFPRIIYTSTSASGVQASVNKLMLDVSRLTSQLDSQEKKYASILSGILSQISPGGVVMKEIAATNATLVTTVDELKKVKSEFNKVKQDNLVLNKTLTFALGEIRNLRSTLWTFQQKYNTTRDKLLSSTQQLEMNQLRFNKSDILKEVVQLKTNLTSLKNDYLSTEGDVTHLKTKVASVRTDLNQALLHVSSTTMSLLDLTKDMTSVKKGQDTLNRRLDSTFSNLTAIKTEFSKIPKKTVPDPRINTLATNVAMLNSSLSVVSSEMTILKIDLSNVSARKHSTSNVHNETWIVGHLSSLSSQLQHLSAEQVPIQRSLTSVQNNIRGLKTDLTSTERKMVAFDSTIGACLHKLQTTQTKVTAINTTQVAHGKQITLLQRELTSVAANSSSLISSFGQLQKSLSTMKSNHQHIISRVQRLSSRLQHLNNTESAMMATAASEKSKLSALVSDVTKVKGDFKTCMKSLRKATSSIATQQTSIHNIQRDASTTKKSVTVNTADIKKLNPQLSSLSSDLRDLTGELQTAKSHQNTLQTNFASVSAKISKLQTSVSTVKVPSVYFKATLHRIFSSLAGTIIFDGVDFNVGSGYSEGTGSFTAPYTGLYAFDVITTFGGSGVTHVTLKNGRTTVSKVGGFVSTMMETATISTVLHLNKGSEVHVYKEYASQTVDTIMSGFSQFSGCLLHT